MCLNLRNVSNSFPLQNSLARLEERITNRESSCSSYTKFINDNHGKTAAVFTALYYHFEGMKAIFGLMHDEFIVLAYSLLNHSRNLNVIFRLELETTKQMCIPV